MNLRTLLIGLSVGLLAISAMAADPAESVRAADQEWMRVFSALDLDRSVAMCAEDGSVLAPNAPIAVGHDAIRKLFSVFFGLPSLKIAWHVGGAEVAHSGDMAYTTGVYEMAWNDPSGKPMSDHGKYVTVWKKQRDGAWKVKLDIFNSDVPIAAAAQ